MIDEATGLPELPEGQYWRVLNGDWARFTEGWIIRIEETPQKPHWSEWRHDPYPLLAAWSDEEKRTITTGRTWYGKRTVEHQRRDWIKPEAKMIWQTHIRFKSHYPSPASIRHAAERVLEELAEFREAQKLIGKYPPNKLETP